MDRQGGFDLFPALSVSTVVLACEITCEFVTIWIGISISSSLSKSLLACFIFFVTALTSFLITGEKKEQPSEQNRDLCETRIRNLRDMQELKRVQELRVKESSRRRSIENQDTINELTARIQELHNEVHCIMTREILKMLNQYAVDYPTFTVNLRYFTLS